MSKVTVNGQEFDSYTDAITVLSTLKMREDAEKRKKMPEFAMMTVNYLSCSWCDKIIAEHVLSGDRQQAEYEHIRTVHPEAEEFFFHRA